MSESLRKFSVKLKAWNNDTFGNVFRRKKKAGASISTGEKSIGIKCINITTKVGEETERREMRCCSKRKWCEVRKQERIGSGVGMEIQSSFTLVR